MTEEAGTSTGALARHAGPLLAGVLFLVSAAAALLRGDAGAAVIPVVLLPALVPPVVVEKWAAVRIPARLLVLYTLLLVGGPYLGTHLDLYSVWAPWDTAVHFYSGFVVGLGAVFVLGVTALRYGLDLPPWFEAVFVLAAGTTVAVLWEVAEFAADALIGTEAQQDNLDTMQDLVAGGTSAALVAAALLLFRSRGWFASLAPLRRVSRHPAAA